MLKINLELIFSNFERGISNDDLLIGLKQNINRYMNNDILSVILEPFNEIKFYNHKLGKYYVHEILLLEHELIQIYLYNKYRNFKKFADLGSNVGLHSLLASQIFNEVKSFEPESHTYGSLKKNVELNKLTNITLFNKAVSLSNTNLKFIKNYENPTSNHLDLSIVSDEYNKNYQNLELIEVQCESIFNVLETSDILKIDIEGHEGMIFKNLDANKIKNKILFVEIHNDSNSKDIQDFYIKNKRNLKCYLINKGIKTVTSVESFPKRASDGSIIFECE